MKRPPCLRNLHQFRKGCPQREWNGEDGCTAWIDVHLPTKGGNETIHVKECLDLHMARLVFHTNCLLEGNQQAMETFRNGMVEQDSNGNIRPKSSPAELALYHAVQKQAQQLHQKRSIKNVTDEIIETKRIEK